MGRCDARGPIHAVLVVALLDDSRHRACHANAVATHDVGLLDTIGIHIRGVHGL